LAFLSLYNQLDDGRKAAIEDDYKNIMKARANQGFDEQNTKEEKGTQKTIGRKEDIYEYNNFRKRLKSNRSNKRICRKENGKISKIFWRRV